MSLFRLALPPLLPATLALPPLLPATLTAVLAVVDPAAEFVSLRMLTISDLLRQTSMCRLRSASLERLSLKQTGHVRAIVSEFVKEFGDNILVSSTTDGALNAKFRGEFAFKSEVASDFEGLSLAFLLVGLEHELLFDVSELFVSS